MSAKIQEELLHSKYDRVREQSYLALDMSSWEEANKLVALFGEVVDGYKVGLQLFHADGPNVLEQLRVLNKRIFLDVKLHDIPNTVAGALRAICESEVEMVNVHAAGGRKMLELARQAVDASPTKPLLVAVTALTSLGDADLLEVGFSLPAPQLVLRLAGLAFDCGLDGVVASAMELSAIRNHWQSPFEVVVPGTRLPGGELHDQVRTLSPGAAMSLGASRLVIGRAVTGANNPLTALQTFWDDMLSKV